MISFQFDFFLLKKHYCSKCGNILVRKKLIRIIDRRSEEAYKYAIFDNISRGDIKLTTYYFECLRCNSMFAFKLLKDEITTVAGLWKDVFTGNWSSLAYKFGNRTGMAAETVALMGIGKGISSIKSTPKIPKNLGKPFKPGQRVGTTQIGVDPNTLKLNTNILPGKYQNALAKCSNGIYDSIQTWIDGTVYNGNRRVAIARDKGWMVDVEIFRK